VVTSAPRISLEQWRCLAAVVEAGGYAQAAERLHKSQSSVTYAVQKLQSTLKVSAFEIQGRKAVLTGVGQMLYRRARTLLDDAGDLERAARKASAGWEAEIGIAVEALFPTWLMFECLSRFGTESPQTRIEWRETVIGGTAEAFSEGVAELGIAARVPTGLAAETLMSIPFVPVAHPDHPLHKLAREITMRDLRKHRHLVIRDSSTRRDKKSATLEVEQRWTVTNLSTSIGAVSRGHGFAWLPQDKIRAELDEGQLKILPLRGGRERVAQLYMFFADADAAGPGTRRLAQIVREEVAGACRSRGADPGR
jgi:DNA-binding transcriptional LysR family regulator